MEDQIKSFNKNGFVHLQPYFHVAIGFIALSLGYPNGGSVFIFAMAPYLVYMVIKCDAKFLPALILHCASETSAATVVFLGFILLSVLKYKELSKLKLEFVVYTLWALLPVFLWLVWYRITTMAEYPPLAFSYIGYYLSFFAFLYGALIFKTFTRQILITLYITLFVVYLTYLMGFIQFTRIIVAFTFIYMASISILIEGKIKNKLLAGITLFALISFFTGLEDSTFTMLFVSLFSFFLSLMYFKNKNLTVLKFTGYLPFILIVGLYIYGISNYYGTQFGYVPGKINITNLRDFSTQLSWKFFADRAPYWAGGFNQIVNYKHLFPVPDIPNIYAITASNSEIEITFGSHTTFIELFRKYGILPGFILSYVLIYLVIKSRKVFLVKNMDPYIIPFYSMAFATTIILSLTGQYQILPSYTLLSLGVIGIAYSHLLYSKSIKK